MIVPLPYVPGAHQAEIFWIVPAEILEDQRQRFPLRRCALRQCLVIVSVVAGQDGFFERYFFGIGGRVNLDQGTIR